MKLNKERVFDFMKTLSECAPDMEGITTEDLADMLKMQRTNISAILNELTKGGKVEKIKGRPIHFRLVVEKRNEFDGLSGYDGSLKNAVTTAKAVILYPKNNLQVLLTGKGGSGKSEFVRRMYCFALNNNVFGTNAMYQKYNCGHYANNQDEFERIFAEIFDQEVEGIVFIDHIEKLDAKHKRFLFKTFEERENDLYKKKQIFILGIDCDGETNENEIYCQKIPMSIYLPSLNQRSLIERYLLIERFFKDEIDLIDKKIVIDPGLMKCLLLYDCNDNIKILQRDIKTSIAKAYGRCINSQIIVMTFSDFPAKVRSGYLFYKKNKYQIDQLVDSSCKYCMDSSEKTFNKEISFAESKPDSLYKGISGFKKVDEILEQTDEKVVLQMIEDTVEDYVSNVDEKVDVTQITKICDKTVVNEVYEFLNKIKEKSGKIYPTTIVYSLCLHMNSLLDGREKNSRFSMHQVAEVMNDYSQEYQWSIEFCTSFEKKHKVKLSIDEAVYVTMFLVNQNDDLKHSDQVAVLLAMHGKGSASSVADTVRVLIGSTNIHGFDLDLDEDISDIYKKLKNKIIEINNNRGVLVIYDMGSFKTMLQTIELETDISLKSIEIPLTLVAIDSSRKAQFGKSLDEIYTSLKELTRVYSSEETTIYAKVKTDRVIITLCMSGEGGAKIVKEYLEEKCEIRDIQIIPLAISNRNELLSRLTDINSKQKIECIIGNYNPQLYGIRYISFEELFATDKADIRELLLNEKKPISEVDTQQIFEYLKGQLKSLNNTKTQLLLLDCVNKMSSYFKLSKSVSIGLIMHIASMFDNLVRMSDMPEYSNCEEILKKYSSEAKKIKTCLGKLEEAFGVDVSDNEIAGIISIIKKL